MTRQNLAATSGISMRLVCQTLFRLVIFRLASAQIRYSTDLNCDFASECRWHNATALSLLGWSHTNDLMPDSRFPVSSGDKTNDFIYTFGPPGMHQIELVSDIITCQLGGARLSFWYYYSGPRSRLDVCTRWPPGSTDPLRRHCYEPTAPAARGAQWTLAVVELPPISQSMEIVLRAHFEPPNDLVAVDDLKYEAILCENTHRFGSSSGGGGEIDEEAPLSAPPLVSRVRQLPSVGETLDSAHEIFDAADSAGIDGSQETPPPRSPFSERSEFDSRRADGGTRRHAASNAAVHSNCRIDCDFDASTFCQLSNVNDSASNAAAWTIGASAMWNPITGIESDASKSGFFASTTRTNNREQRFVIGTNGHFMLLEPSTLQFSYYNSGVRGRLRVCTDFPTAAVCPFVEEGSDMSADWRQWRTAMVKLKPGKTKLHFIADQLTANYVIGLDDIQIRDKFARLPALCQVKSEDDRGDDYPFAK